VSASDAGQQFEPGFGGDLNRLGSYIGVMAQSNADQGADGMQASDLATAHALGRRVVAVAAAYDRTQLA
jgi:hypothetical protein